MPPSLTDELCTICGLCCDGSLLDDVELQNEHEATGLELMGLTIDTDAEAPSMPLPCTALKGKRCSIYAHRPKTCRRFECKLLLNAQHGNIAFDQAKSIIVKTQKQASRIKSLCTKIEGAACEGGLREMSRSVFENHEPQKDPQQSLYDQLSQEVDLMDDLVNTHFLDQ